MVRGAWLFTLNAPFGMRDGPEGGSPFNPTTSSVSGVSNVLGKKLHQISQNDNAIA